MSSTWMNYKGKQILYVDLRGLREEQVTESIEEEVRLIQEAQGNVLILANVEGAAISTLGQIKQVGKDAIGPRTEKSAILGISGLKGILLSAYNTFTGSNSQPFADEAEALEWLVSSNQ